MSNKAGGKRIGSGRKKGVVGLEKTKVMVYIRKRVSKNLDTLLSAQLQLARGCSFLYKAVTKGTGKTSKKERVLVTDKNEISDYLDGKFEGMQDYYYVTTEKPDNKAIESLLDRALGKSTSNLDVKSDGKPIPILSAIFEDKS